MKKKPIMIFEGRHLEMMAMLVENMGICKAGRRLIVGENTSDFVLVLVPVPEMDKTVDSTGSKNKEKLPTDMSSSRTEFPSSESQVQIHEVAEWNNFIAEKIEELLFSHQLEALFRKAMKHFRGMAYTWGKGILCQILHMTYNMLKGKQVTSPTDIVFESFQEFLNYIMEEIISVILQLKSSLTVGEAMWLLLVRDFNLSQASTMEVDHLSGLVSKGESFTSFFSKCPSLEVLQIYPKANIALLLQKFYTFCPQYLLCNIPIVGVLIPEIYVQL
ncbi:hypothetical protein L6164_011651 [Bauhinia variegata]|uniref:Uncharacterized protein n=1 Tax=Bauhinia variegata TaxID=167791 RepID=A0ACB9P7E1_BAUVA|nr:hypothetical protein L6164_011651 [Bauhinia variegata]